MWHCALAGATGQSGRALWLFRFYFPKPGEEDFHEEWKRWLSDQKIWPTLDELADGTYEKFLPKQWRTCEYKEIQLLEELAAVRSRKRLGSWQASSWTEPSSSSWTEPDGWSSSSWAEPGSWSGSWTDHGWRS